MRSETCAAERCENKLPPLDLDGDNLGSRYARALASVPRLCDPCIDAQDAAFERREREAAVRRRRDAAAIPRTLAEVTFDRLVRDEGRTAAIEDAERWAAGEVDGLVLAGEVGAGKTWIAAAAANRMLERASLRWVTTPALLEKALSGDTDEKRQAVNVLLARTGAIVLDDFDKVNSRSEWAVAELFQAVDNAVVHGRPLLVTTNLGARELAARFGEAICSRLVGYCRTHRIEGHDRRGRAA